MFGQISKSIFSHWILSFVLGSIFILEICLLTDVQEVGGKLYNYGFNMVVSITDNHKIPHDRRKTAPEIRKYISTSKVHIGDENIYKALAYLITVKNSNYSEHFFQNKIEIIGIYIYNHKEYLKKIKEHPHGPPNTKLA